MKENMPQLLRFDPEDLRPRTTAQTCITRYHDFSCGHRVVRHEGKCALLHGHNYRVHFTASAPALDDIGRIIDFSALKDRMCDWVEINWDHRFLAWRQDAQMIALASQPAGGTLLEDSIVWVPFNPTAENMALHLLNVIGPEQLLGTGVKLARVRLEETRKCLAEVSLA